MLAQRNPLAIYRPLKNFAGVVTWFAVMGIAGYAIYSALIYEFVYIAELDETAGFVVLLGLCLVLGGRLIFLSLMAPLDGADPDLPALVSGVVAIALWILCGLHMYFVPSFALQNSDEIRILADESIVRFGESAVPRGIFTVRSASLKLSFTFTDEEIKKDRGIVMREVINAQVTLRADQLKEIIRDLHVENKGKIYKVPIALHERAKAFARSEIALKRQAGIPIVSGQLPAPAPWIESILITKVVRERTETKIETK